VIPNANVISPGPAYSHTAMHNSLGCRVRGLPLVMYASNPAKTPFVMVNKLVTVNPCEQTWTGNSSVAGQVRYR